MQEIDPSDEIFPRPEEKLIPASPFPLSQGEPPPFFQKYVKQVWVFIGLIVVILIGSGGYIVLPNKTPQKVVPTSTQIDSPIPTPDPTADWKTYKASTVSIRYPSSWTVEFGFAPISNPKTFNLKTDLEEANTSISQDCDPKQGECPKVFQTVYKSEVTFKDYGFLVEETIIRPTGRTMRAFIVQDNNMVIHIQAKPNNTDNNRPYTVQEHQVFEQMLSTFKFTNASVTQDQAVFLVKNLDSVKAYLQRVPQGIVEFDHEDRINGSWVIHVYEVANGHTATFNWFNVSKTDGTISTELSQ